MQEPTPFPATCTALLAVGESEPQVSEPTPCAVALIQEGETIGVAFIHTETQSVIMFAGSPKPEGGVNVAAFISGDSAAPTDEGLCVADAETVLCVAALTTPEGQVTVGMAAKLTQ